LRITVGPLAAATITTATMWRWEPRYRVTYRARPLLIVGLAASVVIGLVTPMAGALLAVGFVLLGLLDFVVLRHRVRKSLTFTTHGATA
jgi:hypothetical protein